MTEVSLRGIPNARKGNEHAYAFSILLCCEVMCDSYRWHSGIGYCFCLAVFVPRGQSTSETLSWENKINLASF